MEEFTIADAHAVHTAMIEALHRASERKERMPTSAKAIEGQAAALKACRDKIVERLPLEQRKNYE